MSAFTTPAILTMLPNRIFSVYEMFEFHVGEYPSETVIDVPAGFITDLASVPRLFWSIFPPYGNYAKAAIIHDYLYRTASYDITRKGADDIFLEGMTVLKVAAWRKYAIYWAVRLFGWMAFEKRLEK